MLRLVAIILVLVLVVLAVVLSLSTQPLPQADFAYVLPGSIETLDPARMSWHNEIQMALSLWEGLATYDPQTIEPVSAVARIPPRIDPAGLVYTFELRSDARWSNGDPVTADDFVYAWRRAIEPGTAKDYAFLINENIAGAQRYSDWRNRAVRILGLLRDLDRNGGLAPADRRFIGSLHLPGADWADKAGRFRTAHLAALDRQFAGVGIQAIDARHLQVTLVRPTAYFLDLVAFSTFLPIHAASIEKLRITDDPAVTDLALWCHDPQWVKPDYHRNGYPGLVTNGPYRLADWQFKRYMLFDKNPHYWDNTHVPSERIMARIITEPSTAFLAYERGDIDWYTDVPVLNFASALVEQARTGARDDIHIYPAFGTYFYNFNCRDRLDDGSVNPFADPLVRMAFNLAVDKRAITDQVRKIGNTVARNFIPPGSIAGYSCPPGPDYDLSRARELLARAGFADSRSLPTIDILYNTGGGHESVAQAIAEMWRNGLGVKISLSGKEKKTFADDKKNHRFMVCRASWFGDYGDPTTFLDMMVTDNGNNDSAFSCPRYDELIRSATAATSPAERMRILARAEHLLMHEQLPILPLYYYVHIRARRSNVSGLYPNARGLHLFKYIRVTH